MRLQASGPVDQNHLSSKRWRAVAVLSFCLAGLLVLPGVASATVNGETVTPYNQGGEWWSTDGCSYVPDSGPTFNFHHACVHHDGCYLYGWASRSTCDWWFRNDMRSSCRAMHSYYSWRRAACYGVANVYWSGVRAFGWLAYRDRTMFARVG